ncbi:glycosyltransferase family 4 protein [Streptomyces sp. MS2.AVA.5]|uniref:Glycosyltransferase family 4 protein n=1 Tax=Streptomyces achmelvichensis TaxID=3134111 RepID=A0ACC6Q8U7_9ACTN
MKLSFLTQDIYGVGGTNRAVITLANALSTKHEVQIASVFGSSSAPPAFDIARNVAVVPLAESFPDSGSDLPSELIPVAEPSHRRYTRADDERIQRFLRATTSDVLIGTRPGLNLAIAALGPEHAVKIAQEHMTYDAVPPAVLRLMRDAYASVDAAVTLTSADAAQFREGIGLPGLRVLSIPNAVPVAVCAPASLTTKIVMAAGRLVPEKRYDILIRAFARAVALHPEWRLRIYGAGLLRDDLNKLVTELGLHNHVFFMGKVVPLGPEWAKASIAAVTSSRESFGLTLVEAMNAGVPMVSTNAPSGPAEIITDHGDGILTPVNDIDGFAEALTRLMGDDELRRDMGDAALASSARYQPQQIAERYEALFEELAQQRPKVSTGLGRLLQRQRSRNSRPPAGLFTQRTASDALGLLTSARMESDGSLQLTLHDHTASADGHVEVRARRTHPSRANTVVTAPLIADGAAAVAVLPAADIIQLGEGRYDFYRADANHTRTRLTASSIDLRALVTGDRRYTSDEVGNATPYRTQDGFLSLRMWKRTPHCELHSVHYREEAVVLRIRCFGAWSVQDPVLVLSRRQHPSAQVSFSTEPVDAQYVDCVIRVPDLAQWRVYGQENWDCFLTDRAGSKKARIAMFLDDILEKKAIKRYPELVCEEAAPAELYQRAVNPTRIVVRPYFTADNDVSIVMTELI